MRITVKYMAQLKQAAGVAGETLDLPPECTIDDVGRALVERHGDLICPILFRDNGTPHPAMLFFVGDEQVRPGVSLTFKDGDVVTILAPMAGGGR